MTWQEYLPLAEKTLSTQFNCDELFHQKILHSVIGSLTEVEEILENYVNGELITDVNKQGSIAEETADIFWYISILYRELEITDHQYNIEKKNPFEILLDFTKVSLKFLDLLKKKIYYNKDIDNSLMIDLSSRMYCLMVNFCYQYNTDISNILDKNIDKLRARYGDKFSSEKAINRNLEVEKQILENGKS